MKFNITQEWLAKRLQICEIDAPRTFCPVCGTELKERNKVLECQNKCDRTTARVPMQCGRDYESIGDGCFVKSTQYKE